MTKGTSLLERTMTSSEKRKDTMLKKKYDDSDMKKNMQAQYGKEEGKKIYFATIRKQAMKKEEVILERQKTNQGHRQSEEQHRSNYGKASIRNVRATGKGGNAADPAERLVAMDARHKAHKEKRGVKTKGMKEEVGISSAVKMKKARDEAMLRLKEKQAVARKMKKEEVEVVNELSKSTLLGYVQKGTRDIATRSNDASIKGMAGKRKEADKGYEKVAKRVAGVNKAAGKLSTEGAEKTYYIDKEAEKRGMERDARRAQNKAAAKERAAAKRRAERNQLRRQGQYGAQGKYYVTKHMEREEVEYTGPNKEDKKLIKKMDNPSYAKKLANYEKNMDPKKRQELKNKAIKGMKFTHEGTSYGLYKGSGKASGAMKDYLDKKAKMLTKKRNKQSDAAKNNPHFDSTQPSPSGRNKYEEVQRDGYGDPIGGPKISKKQKAKNLASNTPDEQHTTTTSEAVTFQHFMEKCWKGYEKKGMKTMFGKRYPNCVKKEEVELTDEGYGSDRVGPALTMARVIDKVNPKPKMGSKRTAVSNMLKMASIKKDEKLRKQKENPYSAKNKLKMVVRSISQNARSKAGATKEEYIPEEGYDIARDMGRVRPSKDKKDGTTMPPSAEMKKTQKINKGPSAAEIVKKKYGKAVMNIKKK